MRIGYGKIGRSWKLDPTNGTTTGGDADVARALHILSRERPEDTFVLIGQNSGEDPQSVGYPANVVNPWTDIRPRLSAAAKELKKECAGDRLAYQKALCSWYMEEVIPGLFDDLDHVIVWAGQHGSSNMPIPMTDDRNVLTTPQDSFILYASYLLMGINRWRDVDPVNREEVWLVPDPRNYLKLRDLKHPLRHPILAQYEMKRQIKHERFGDPTEPTAPYKWDKLGGVWVGPSVYEASMLEMTALPQPQRVAVDLDHTARLPFGMIVNENRAYVKNDRATIVKEWVIDTYPEAEIFGKWSDEGAAKIGRESVRSCPYEFLGSTLQRWMTTLTTPASGSGWATAKPWECFAYGVVCFFHPQYDTQDHILRHAPDWLRQWLRVSSPEDMWQRINYLNENPDVWRQIVAAQRDVYEQAYAATHGGVASILERINA